MKEPPPPKLYLPLKSGQFEPGAYRPSMGLTAISRDAMFEIDARYHAELALKRALLAERRAAVFAALPVSDAVRLSVARYVAETLAVAHPGWFAWDGERFENRLSGVAACLEALPDDPLAWIGGQVQEDLCLLQRIGGQHCLTAASLSFPSRWRLAEKLGQPMAVIHQPVPDYAERLERPVARFFEHLKQDRAVCRFNWTIHDDAALHQPEPSHPGLAVAVDALFLRVERQTLSLVPGSLVPGTDAILFTIKVQVTPLAEAVAVPSEALQLAEAVRELPEATLAYRGMGGFRDALLEYLHEKAAALGGAAACMK